MPVKGEISQQTLCYRCCKTELLSVACILLAKNKLAWKILRYNRDPILTAKGRSV